MNIDIMPVNDLRYSPQWRDVIRPRILKRDNYKCKGCGLPSNARYVMDDRGNWTVLDEVVERWAERHNETVRKAILAVAHINHLTFDNREENLKSLCRRCHLEHDRSHKAEMARMGLNISVDAMLVKLSAQGGERYLNHAFSMAKSLGRQVMQLELILQKRGGEMAISDYDNSVRGQIELWRSKREKLVLKCGSMLLEIFEIQTPRTFLEEFLNRENRLIGLK